METSPKKKKIYKWQISTKQLKDGYNQGTDNHKCDKDMKKLELLYFANDSIK